MVSLNSILKLKFSASDQAIIVSNKKRSRNIFLFSVDESFLINLYRLEKIKLFFLKNNFKKGLMKIPLLIKIAADILVLRFFRRGKNKNQGSLHTAENSLLPGRINWTFH